MKFEVIKQELAFSEMSQFTCRTARIGLFTVDMQMQLSWRNAFLEYLKILLKHLTERENVLTTGTDPVRKIGGGI